MNPTESESRHWHILTGEYPPRPGGVADYTWLVAGGLARGGDRVTVWTTPTDGALPETEGVTVERWPGLWSARGLAALGRELDTEPAPRRLLVQYTATNFGYRGVNLAFGPWLARRRAAGDDIWAMVHEVKYPFLLRDKPTRWLIAAASVWNARALMAACNRVFYSIQAWEPLLRRYDSQGNRPLIWLPVPATIPRVHDPEAVARVRRQIAPAGELIVGHFGTFGLHAPMLGEVLRPLLVGRSDRVGLMLGRGGKKFAAEQPELAGRLVATNGLPAEEMSIFIQACDVMIQPYVDGLSSRRTTVMAALAHGRPVVSGIGFLSEPFWSEWEGLSLVASNEPGSLAAATEALLSNPAARTRLGEAARTLYDSQFALEHTIEILRHAGDLSQEKSPVKSGREEVKS